MQIGEVATRSGLSTATIRFYERAGVLPPPERKANGYRDYTPTDVDRAATFARFRGLGIEPAEAGRLADQCATGRCDDTWVEMPALLRSHRQALATQIAELQALDARLAALQAAMTSTGQSNPSTPVFEKEIAMTRCTCDDGCCGGPTVPCC
jgi:MerR family transcriptional regulator, Zn(II)-responsive regulator of zntA